MLPTSTSTHLYTVLSSILILRSWKKRHLLWHTALATLLSFASVAPPSSVCSSSLCSCELQLDHCKNKSIIGIFWKKDHPPTHLRQLLGSQVLCLLLVDEFHEDTLVLENISLHLQIESVIATKGRRGGGRGDIIHYLHQLLLTHR